MRLVVGYNQTGASYANYSLNKVAPPVCIWRRPAPVCVGPAGRRRSIAHTHTLRPRPPFDLARFGQSRRRNKLTQVPPVACATGRAVALARRKPPPGPPPWRPLSHTLHQLHRPQPGAPTRRAPAPPPSGSPPAPAPWFECLFLFLFQLFRPKHSNNPLNSALARSRRDYTPDRAARCDLNGFWPARPNEKLAHSGSFQVETDRRHWCAHIAAPRPTHRRDLLAPWSSSFTLVAAGVRPSRLFMHQMIRKQSKIESKIKELGWPLFIY